MAEYRCCRLHRLFVILLALAVLGLVAHPLADVIASASVEKAAAPLMQETLKAQMNRSEACSAASLHGGFFLNALPHFGHPLTSFQSGDTAEPLGLTWVPPTLVPPPISL
jgi:hypothetical protein